MWHTLKMATLFICRSAACGQKPTCYCKYSCPNWCELSGDLSAVNRCYRLSYCFTTITHSIPSLNTNTSINALMEQQLRNVDVRENTRLPDLLLHLRTWRESGDLKTTCFSDRCYSQRRLLVFFWFLFFFFFFRKLNTFLVSGRFAAPPSVDAELNRNVRSVCLASRGTVRVSGGLKSSWGRAVGRHSSMTFLSCYSHQTPFSNQSLFAEIPIGLDWNAAAHSAHDKISQNSAAEERVLWHLHNRKETV